MYEPQSAEMMLSCSTNKQSKMNMNSALSPLVVNEKTSHLDRQSSSADLDNKIVLHHQVGMNNENTSDDEKGEIIKTGYCLRGNTRTDINTMIANTDTISEMEIDKCTFRKLYAKYFKQVYQADEEDQLKYEMKIRAAVEQYLVLIILGLSLCLITSISAIEWNWTKQWNYFLLCFTDVFLDATVQGILEYYGCSKDLPTLELVHIFKNLMLGTVRIVNQCYSGFHSPIWFINGYALVIFSHVAFFRNGLSLAPCILLLISSVGGQLLSYRLAIQDIDSGGRFMTLTHLEKQTPHFAHYQDVGLYHQTIFHNAVLQILILVLGVMFSRDVEEQYSKSIRYEYQIRNEKFLNASKTKFIGNLSHEMRNPLHGMIGIVEILKIELRKIIGTLSETDFTNPEKRETVIKEVISSNESGIDLIEDVHNNAKMLLNIFSNSLQISSLELGQLKLNYDQFNILEMTDSIISVFATIAKDKGLVLQSFFDFEKVPIVLKADHVRLSQILINLVSNSIKYTKVGKVILCCGVVNSTDSDFPFNDELELQVGEETIRGDGICYLKIECKDTGIGMDPEQLSKLFEPFQILQGKVVNLKENVEFDRYYSQSMMVNNNSFNDSHGLGLNISNKLITLMKGKIHIESKVAVGTIMTIYIPVGKCSQEECRAYYEPLNQKIEELRAGNVERIILLDDDEVIRDILKKYCNFVLQKPIMELSTEKEANSLFNSSTLENHLVFYNSNRFSSPLFTKLNLNNNTIIQLCCRSKTSSLNSLYLPFKFEKLVFLLHNHLIVKGQQQKLLNVPDKGSKQEVSHSSLCKRALVVDDNDVNRKVLQKLMNLLGFKVETASDGLEAFEMVKKSTLPYDIILMDLLMPVLCGKESCKLMRGIQCTSKIIAVTANIWEGHETIQQAGFDSVLRKPVMLNDLRKELSKYVDQE